MRFTVRPSGHPVSRTATLAENLKGIPSALVVDELPGISGSSLVSVASALLAAGLPEISFFPGHNGEPSGSVSPETRNYWTQIPRYFTALDDLHWNGKSLHAALAEQSQRFAKTFETFGSAEDLSGSNWR